jgi:2-polyprenyl-3-methyl-5-hydroxy-6-metoxy-1,4-benzoquinol methylase
MTRTETGAGCAACGHTPLVITRIAGLRCGHAQRIDLDRTDYGSVVMGQSGRDPERLASQAAFLNAHLDQISSILEVGCAGGDLADTLHPNRTVSRYDGIEFSLARKKAEAVMNRVFTTTLPELLAGGIVAPGDYDLVISSHCLEHVPDIATEIAAMRQVCRPGGILFLEVPNGSGHPDLPFDDNRAHLHFFSMASLVRVAEAGGFTIQTLVSGARYDSRYPDSLRLIARAKSATPAVPCLADHPSLQQEPVVVIWGAGRMVDELLAHFFDPRRVAFFVDADPAKQGGQRLGRAVRPVEALLELADPLILINSLEYEAEIRRDITLRFGTRFPRILGIAALLQRDQSAG